jgi:hypothetical protein
VPRTYLCSALEQYCVCVGVPTRMLQRHA